MKQKLQVFYEALQVVYHVSDIEVNVRILTSLLVVVYHVSDIEERVERPRTRRPVVYHVSDIEAGPVPWEAPEERCLSCK